MGWIYVGLIPKDCHESHSSKSPLPSISISVSLSHLWTSRPAITPTLRHLAHNRKVFWLGFCHRCFLLLYLSWLFLKSHFPGSNVAIILSELPQPSAPRQNALFDFAAPELSWAILYLSSAPTVSKCCPPPWNCIPYRTNWDSNPLD